MIISQCLYKDISAGMQQLSFTIYSIQNMFYTVVEAYYDHRLVNPLLSLLQKGETKKICSGNVIIL